MSDTISKQAAIRAFAEYEKRTTPSWSGAYKETLEEWIDELTETLSDVPIIDLVRCRECKHVDSKKCPMYLMGLGYTDDDFCSYGERRNDG